MAAPSSDGSASDVRSTQRLRSIGILLLSLLAGLAVVVGSARLLTTYRQRLAEAQAPEELTTVLVASRDLYQGVPITEADVFLIEMPQDLVHPRIIRSPDMAIGRVPVDRILANEFIRPERLADARRTRGLNAIVPEGMRALSLNINGGNALRGLLRAGNYVDILVNIEETEFGEPTGKTWTFTIMQGVYVLAVDSEMADMAASPEKPSVAPSVTFAVTPAQAEQLVHANAGGTLSLTLRNDLDVVHRETQGASTVDLFGLPAGPAPEAVERSLAQPRKEVEVKGFGTLLVVRGDSAELLEIQQ